MDTNSTTDIKKQIQSDMERGINSVLDGKVKKFKSHFINPEMIVRFMESLDWEKGDLETNGWQYDWWIPFTKDEKSFTASGGGYYGDFSFTETENI